VNLLLPGVYVSADSILHRLDPRVKMGTALLLMALPFAAPGLGSTLLLLMFVATIALLSTAPLPALLHTLSTIFWVGFFMFFFYLFTTPGRSLVAWGTITITWEGLLAGIVQIYRLSLLVIVAALLTFTTSSSQLAHGLEALLRPLIRLGFPVRELALVLTIALRFTPTLFDEVDQISKAQRARGLDVVSKNPWQRVQSWVPMFVPIFVSAFHRAEALATAMEARGFRGVQQRTHLRRLRLARRDLVAALVVLAISAAAVGLDRLL